MKRTFVWVTLIFATSVFTATTTVNADFVLSGYSSFVDKDATVSGVQLTSPAGSANAVVNFAVYQNPSGHNWTTDLGLSPTSGGVFLPDGPVDTTAPYVYLYQVVNTGTSPLELLQIGVNPNEVTSSGYIGGQVFTDANGLITNLNPYLGTPNPSSQPLEAGGNGVPTSLGGLTGTGSAAGVAPVFESFSPGPGGTLSPNASSAGVITYTFSPVPNFSINIGGYSTLLFLTSSSPYTYLTSAIHDGSATYNELPSAQAVPLPPALALFASGLPVMFGVGLFLRRKQQTTTHA